MECVLNPSKLGVVYQDFAGLDGFCGCFSTHTVRTWGAGGVLDDFFVGLNKAVAKIVDDNRGSNPMVCSVRM